MVTAQAAAPTGAPTKKKKKPRWRNQKTATLVVRQLAYAATERDVAAALTVDGRAPTIRLVRDAASQGDGAAGREHAGLAYPRPSGNLLH